ncbi:MAG TPA: hypothetical protein PLI71_09375 [Clostridia bacterium]|nr:hypothetical protein [Clostridia bacterium]
MGCQHPTLEQIKMAKNRKEYYNTVYVEIESNIFNFFEKIFYLLCLPFLKDNVSKKYHIPNGGINSEYVNNYMIQNKGM